MSDTSHIPDSGATGWRDCVWLFAVIAATILLCQPFLRSIGWMGDEGILIHGAERALRGQKLYRDTFSFLPPGGYVITQAWFAVAGLSMLSARVLAVASIVGIAAFTFFACRTASKHTATAALITVGWVLTSQGFWTQVSYHWFCTLFAMIAAGLCLREPTSRRAVLAGVAIGAAAMVMPTVGALAAVAALTAFIGRGRLPMLIAYVIGCAVVPLALIAYLAVQGSLIAAFEQAILFTATHYAPIQGVPFGFGTLPQNRPIAILYPLLAVWTLYCVFRGRRDMIFDRTLLICIAFAVAGFIGSFPRADVVHISFAAPFACPLLAWCVRRIAQPWPRAMQYVAAIIAIALMVPSAMGYDDAIKSMRTGVKVDTPRGRVRLQGQPGLREMIAHIGATAPTDRFLFYPYMPLLPFVTAREHVAAYDIFVPGYTIGSQYRESCLATMRDAAWVVIDRQWTDPAFLKATFPAMTEPSPPEVKAFEAALDSGFDLAAKEGTFELRKRSTAATEALCAGIPDTP